MQWASIPPLSGWAVPDQKANAGVATYLPDEKEHRRQLANAINNLLKGGLNNFGTVTLTAGQTTTVVSDSRASFQCFIGLMPQTANAAGALASTYILAASRKNGQFTITHANNGQTDRTFVYAILG